MSARPPLDVSPSAHKRAPWSADDAWPLPTHRQRRLGFPWAALIPPLRWLRFFLLPRNFVMLALLFLTYLFAVNSLGISSLDVVESIARRRPRRSIPSAALNASSFHKQFNSRIPEAGPDADIFGEPRSEDIPSAAREETLPSSASVGVLHAASTTDDQSSDGKDGDDVNIRDEDGGEAAFSSADHPSGLREEHCARLRALGALRPVQQATSAQRSSRVLLLTSSWGLPAPHPGTASSSTIGNPVAAVAPPPLSSMQDFDVLMRATAANLANPWVLAVHIFVPSSACANRIAAEDEAVDAEADARAAATVATASSSNRRGKRSGRKRWSDGVKNGTTHGTRGGREEGSEAGGGADGIRSQRHPHELPESNRIRLLFRDKQRGPRGPANGSNSSSAGHNSRVRLIVAPRGQQDAPTWEVLMRYAAAAQAAAPMVGISRADVVWPRGFNCLSAQAMLRKKAVLALSCQTHLPACAPLVIHGRATGGGGSGNRTAAIQEALHSLPNAGGASAPAAADWADAYLSCRERGGARSSLACLPLLDQCFKYSGVQHAILFATPPEATAVAAVKTLKAEYGSETNAADALWRALPSQSVHNPCLEVAPTCLHCTAFPEVQAAARLRSADHLKPASLPAKLQAGDGYCHKVQSEAARGKSASSRAEKQRVVAAGPKTPTMPTLTAEQLSMLTELSSSEKLKLKKAHLPGHHQTSPSKGATNRLGKRKLMGVGGP